jgi:hypothetical protein
MESRAEHTPADAPPMPSARGDVRADVNRALKDIAVLRHLLALHGENYDSRGKSVFAQAVEAAIEERQMQLNRLLPGSAPAPPYLIQSGGVTEV